MKIDFEKMEFYTDMSHTTCIVRNVREELANAIYNNATGIRYHALALKIYNSSGELELNDDEICLVNDFVGMYGTPKLIDAIKCAFGKCNENEIRDKKNNIQ